MARVGGAAEGDGDHPVKRATCHPNRKAKTVAGLCGACYERDLKSRNPAYAERQRQNRRDWAAKWPNKAARAAAKDRSRRRSLVRNGDPAYKQRRRDYYLRHRYGIVSADYERILRLQGGGCALCGRAPGNSVLHVDHDHETNVVRGLLCHQCNWYMGTIDADPTILTRIAAYRRRGATRRAA